MEIMNFVWNYVYLDHGRDFYGFKPRDLLGFHPNPRLLESRVGKTLNGTRKIWNPPFEVRFMV